MEVKLPLETVARLTSRKPDELTEMLFTKDGDNLTPKEDASTLVASLIGEKFTKVGTDKYGQAVKETNTKYEEALAKKGIDINGRRFEDILEEIATTATTKPADKTATLDELLKRSDVSEYLKSATEKQVAALKAELDKTTQELTSTRNEYTRTQRLTVARAALERELDAIGWDDGGELRAARLDLLAKQLPIDRLNVDNGQVVLLDDKGEPMRDNLHNPVPFSAWVEKVNVFPKTQGQAPRSTPPAGNQQQTQPTLKLASEQAGLEMLAAERDPTKRAQILRALGELGRKK